MKKLAILFILPLLMISCCKKEETSKKDPIDQLPPLTHHGANTAGCLVNGEAFLPGSAPMPLKCDYYQQQYFIVALTKKSNHKLYSIIVAVTKHLIVGHTYILTEEFTSSGHGTDFATYSIDANVYPSTYHYNTTTAHYGELTITHHDYNNATISGTFWFNAVNADGDIVHITDGRFDCEY